MTRDKTIRIIKSERDVVDFLTLNLRKAKFTILTAADRVTRWTKLTKKTENQRTEPEMEGQFRFK